MYFVLLSFNALFCSSLWTVSMICCFVTSRFKRILSWIQFPKTLAVFCSTKYGAIDWITSLLRMDSWSFLIGCLSIWRNVKSESKLLIHSEKSSPGCLSNLLSSKLIKFIWSSQLQFFSSSSQYSWEKSVTLPPVLDPYHCHHPLPLQIPGTAYPFAILVSLSIKS